MKYTGLNELREMFLSFYESKGHLRLPSFPLIPINDPSILLINAGMAPLKPYFTGKEVPPSKRVTTCQKCIRTPDIERVGKTARHGTFFEMLGNFSFGDYFKHEATAWAWEFITKVLDMPVDRLWVTIYQDDDEAFDIWTKEVGVDPARIVRMGKEDNFWEIGTGPCGPCSEIYFDRGEKYGCGRPDCGVGCECDRFVEFWNLVFTQFDKDEQGVYHPLAHPNIDTGMGLERLAVIMQDVDNLFEVDTIKNIMNAITRISGVNYKENEKTDVSLRVITDHIRSTVFMVCDGVIPSNEGRGYVLRRLLRRAARHGKLIGIKDAFLYQLADVVIQESAAGYPELKEKAEYIKMVIKAEEESFIKTIDAGMVILDQYIKSLQENKGSKLSGKDIFKLHDTYGFPVDLTKEILEENGLEAEEEEFHRAMQEQKQRSQEAVADADFGWSDDVIAKLSKEAVSEFVGYDQFQTQSVIVDVVEDGVCALLLDKTPFYAESGGQVSDTGVIYNEQLRLEVEEVRKTNDGRIVHICSVESGKPEKGMQVTAVIDQRRRMDTARNHSATHLLQQALRDVLGSHVAQAGSLVEPDRLRFDFSHFNGMTPQQLQKVEEIINEKILEALNVTKREMPIDEAKKLGARALFGEKYGDIVRVVTMGDYSMELCGGCHVNNTSEIGLFKLLSEGGVSAGIRRIEATTGHGVLKYIGEKETLISDTAEALKSNPADIAIRAKILTGDLKEAHRVIEEIRSKMARGMVENILIGSKLINGIRVVTANLEDMSMEEMTVAADQLRERIQKPGVVVLASRKNGKINFLSIVNKQGVAKGLHAGNIIKQVTEVAGGSGGGKPDSARGGGKDESKIDDALAIVDNLVLEIVGKEE